MRVLITGGSGFIGAHLIDYILKTTDWDVICIDKLFDSTKGWRRLKDCGFYIHPRVVCLTWDLQQPFTTGLTMEFGDINIIIHMAAETNVDTSIKDPVRVVQNNVMSTLYLLEYARTLPNLHRFHYFGTDEVFGTAPKGVDYKESDAHNPTNPYSASKSASEQLCISYKHTYGLPLTITNLMNVFGQRQDIGKFIPLVTRRVLRGESITIFTEDDGVTPGTRFYIHARNVASAVLFVLQNGTIGERYNIRGSIEIDNLELAHKIAAILGKELKYTLDYGVVRPGYDFRYALDGSKLAELGWAPPQDFDDRLKETVEWYVEHPEWLEP